MTGPGSPEPARLAEPNEPARIGRYEVLGVLGSGGMATVYLGRLSGPTGFARFVAIKRAHRYLARDPALLAMLLDEARMTARIRHANVAQTLEVVDDDGATAIVMEYVEGVSLLALFNHLVRKGQPMPVDVAVSIVWGVLNGLHAAHEAKGESGESLHIVHRDVSATNVLVGVDGVVRVLDFGVAKARDRLQPSTEHGGVKGTYAYMAPEQVRNQEVDRRSDVYAASVLLWQCLAGRRLWQATDPRAIVAATLFEKPPSLSELRAEVEPALDALVQRGLDKEPDRRFATAREMALALEETVRLMSSASLAEWLQREAPDLVATAAPPTTQNGSTAARPKEPSIGHASHSRQAVESPASEAPHVRDRPHRPWRTRWIAVTAVGLGIAIGVLWLRGDQGPSRSVSPPHPALASDGAPVETSRPATPSARTPEVAVAVADTVVVADAAVREVAGWDAAARAVPPRPATAGAASVPVAAAPRVETTGIATGPTDSGLPAHRRPGVIPDTRR